MTSETPIRSRAEKAEQLREMLTDTFRPLGYETQLGVLDVGRLARDVGLVYVSIIKSISAGQLSKAVVMRLMLLVHKRTGRAPALEMFIPFLAK